MPFVERRDNLNFPYFRYVKANFTSEAELSVPSGKPDISSFLSQQLQITPQTSSLFTNDLTSNDSLLIAILSLLLLLILQDLLSTLLLRTRRASISSTSFSLKHVLDSLHELHLPTVVNRNRRRSPPFLLIFLAVLLTLTTFGLETLVLILSYPRPSPIRNARTALEIRVPYNPTWPDVRYHTRASLNRPCLALSLVPPSSGPPIDSSTRISICVSSSLPPFPFDPFDPINLADNIKFGIHSDFHQYGVDHAVILGEERVNFSTRAYFSLEDGSPRLMNQRAPFLNLKARAEILHLQTVALLFSVYYRDTEDSNVTAEHLNSLKRTFVMNNETVTVPITFVDGPDGQPRKFPVSAIRFLSLFEGPIPVGDGAFRVMHQIFKSAAAVRVRTDGSTEDKDLVVGKGLIDREGVLWTEQGRLLNWLGMLVVLGSVTIIGLLLRIWLRPVSTAELAGGFVTRGDSILWDNGNLGFDSSKYAWIKMGSSLSDSIS